MSRFRPIDSGGRRLAGVSLEIHGRAPVALLAADLGEIDGVHTVAAGDVDEIFGA